MEKNKMYERQRYALMKLCNHPGPHSFTTTRLADGSLKMDCTFGKVELEKISFDVWRELHGMGYVRFMCVELGPEISVSCEPTELGRDYMRSQNNG
jgi:hypothetical protein